MHKLVVAIYDQKAELYQQPILMVSKGQALRGFIDLANDKNTEINRHPEDFSLWHLADYDETSGTFLKVDMQCLGRAHELQNKGE